MTLTGDGSTFARLVEEFERQQLAPLGPRLAYWVAYRSGKLTVSAAEAAKKLGCGRNTVYELIRIGQLRAVRFGRRIRIPLRELDEYLARAVATQMQPDGAK